ncbi:uncharacterized protein LOC108807138 isoform X1 [Raphanus sativus]|uniref:Uncharacterized protein LOC108807138 isoform X1 n=1 Tax=Raphanus sativus TaxID=3726 RepID=A0A6J0JJ94_RAPSA|nr:uncharacterized protein LOC108807138 isoform X1 [Raphanus sativus]XP_018434901.2 uncharacterized protein LOC108807138 isoform X1 [Raphanus sativus]XP_018434909.2 uncharacterized protein LOC108807138 isoform X1 [Raphanus sativus]
MANADLQVADDEILMSIRELFAEAEPDAAEAEPDAAEAEPDAAEAPNYLAIVLARERANKKPKGRKKDPPLTPEQRKRKERIAAVRKMDSKILNARV